jgi:antitoxin (DNA-binding transcriptional repressor) of toxin-antitoxin stability system
VNATAREFNQKASRILAEEETGETITKGGHPVAVLRPYQDDEVPAHPAAPLDDIDIPALNLPALSDNEIDETLRSLGA